MMRDIKGVLLDYGGTIDTNGIHWGEVLWQAYVDNAVPVDKSAFRDAYSYGERALGTRPLVNPNDNFLDVLRIKSKEQFDYLQQQGLVTSSFVTNSLIEKMATQSFEFARQAVSNAAETLRYLSDKYPLVLVSNFYGNINTILKDFSISQYFKSVVESAVVGVRKPDAAIFSLGVQALNMPAENTIVIGDSYSKDIAPGKQAGCQTIWLNKAGWGDDPTDVSGADVVIDDFKALQTIL